jgi:hypothetical protein
MTRAMAFSLGCGALLLALTAAPVQAGEPYARVAADAAVSGAVVDATRNTPVGGVDLRLVGYRDDVRSTTANGRAGGDGSFTFTGLQAGGGWSYEVTVDYLSATYSSGALVLNPGETRAVTLKVYQSTASPAKVVQDSWVVWVDVRGELMAVEQDLVLTNSDSSSYVGGASLDGGRRAVLSLALAADAENLQFLGFLSDRTGQRQDATFVHTGPIPPGQSQAALRYETRSQSELAFPVTFPTTTFTLMVPDTVTVTAPLLTGGSRNEDRGVSYRAYSGANLKAGDTIRATLRRNPGTSSSWNPAVLAGAGLVVVVGVAILMVGRRRRLAVVAPALAPVTRTRRTGAKATPARHGDDVEVLLDHLALLDLAHEGGILPDDAGYQSRRAALTTRLARIWPGGTGSGSSGAGKGGSR